MLCYMQVVATVAHACGELRHRPTEALLDSLEQHAMRCSQDYRCADWSALLQAFSRLQAQPKRLYSALLQEVGSICKCAYMAAWQTASASPAKAPVLSFAARGGNCGLCLCLTVDDRITIACCMSFPPLAAPNWLGPGIEKCLHGCLVDCICKTDFMGLSGQVEGSASGFA